MIVMFEKYSDKAKKSIIYSYETAVHYKSDTITTGYLLLGILRFRQERPAKALASIGVSIESIIRHVENKRQNSKGTKFNDMPFSKKATAVLKAIDKLNYKQVDLEHILLELLSMKTCTASKIMKVHGITEAKLKSKLYGET